MNSQPITHAVTIKPKQIDFVKSYTLEEALESGYPIYTRAKGVPEVYAKGIKPISQIIQDENAVCYDYHFHKVTKTVWLYNHLFKNITLYKPNSLIPL